MGSDFSLASLAEEGRMDFFSPGNHVSFFSLGFIFVGGLFIFRSHT